MVIRSNSGEDAIIKFTDHNRYKADINIQIIIMDINMGKMDGYEASTIIKKFVVEKNYIDCSIIGNSSDSS